MNLPEKHLDTTTENKKNPLSHEREGMTDGVALIISRPDISA